MFNFIVIKGNLCIKCLDLFRMDKTGGYRVEFESLLTTSWTSI